MYYFYQPHHYPFPYGQTAYHSLPVSPSTHSELLGQPLAQRNTGTAKPNSLPSGGQSPVYPAVNPDYLYESAQSSRQLLSEASILLNHLAASKDFDHKLMEAAQRSDTSEVKRLIRSLGITSDVDIRYNPDSLHVEFISKARGLDCCRLTIALRWH